MQTTRGFVRTIFLVTLLLMATGCAHKVTYNVVSVADGDTITVVPDQATRKIRLAGIDAPEKNQPFGLIAKEFLTALVLGKDVEIETGKMDRYGRDVSKVISEGKDMNLAMLIAGLAWHYKKYQTEQTEADRVLYSNAEVDAKAQGVGHWRDPGSIPPWGWRARTR